MTILKLMPIDSTVESRVNSRTTYIIHQWNLDNDIETAFRNIVRDMIETYENLGCNFIGKWEFNTDTSTYDTTNVNDIVDLKLRKYKPYLLVLNDEFVKVEEKEKRDYTNTAHGTTRGAIEDSPITSAPITSAPDDSTEWDLNNPSLKNGSQFDNEYERNEQVLNPEWQLRLLKFNVGELNLTRIAEMFVKSLIEEYNTVY